MIQFMPANNSNTNCVITILIHSTKTHFQNVFLTQLRCITEDVKLSLILTPQIFDVITNEKMHIKSGTNTLTGHEAWWRTSERSEYENVPFVMVIS